MKKILQSAAVLLLLSTLNHGLSTAHAQGTAFTYQGRLNDGAALANGSYDVAFRLFATNVTGSAVAGPVTNAAIAVSNGLFTTSVDFGNAFPGADRWLELAVRTNGSGAFTTLVARQLVAPVPYAIKAGGIIGPLADAALSGNVALLSGLQTFSGIKTFSDVVTFTNTDGFGELRLESTNTKFRLLSFNDGAYIQSGTAWLAGSTNNLYFGGMFGTPVFLTIRSNGDVNIPGNVTAGSFKGPGALSWQTVAATTVQAVANTGYLLTNSALTTITLPAAPALGDIVKVTGAGSGGWRIAQNAGQSVLALSLKPVPATWTQRESSQQWYSVASSADGSRLVAGSIGGKVFTSADSGVTWSSHAPVINWTSLASSADGLKLVVGVENGTLFTSTDAGVNWTVREATRSWEGVASSASGTRLTAVALNNRIYTSTDSGTNWSPHGGTNNWAAIAASADGIRLVAAAAGGQVYVSTDAGTNWTAFSVIADWTGAASSADGSVLAVTAYGGQIYISSDGGVNWIARESSRNWSSIACSADGTRLLASVAGGQLYISTDMGNSWVASESNRSWARVASSANGARLIAVDGSGYIYTASFSTATGVAGYLAGGQSTALELQYIGNGQFIPLSHEGVIQAY